VIKTVHILINAIRLCLPRLTSCLHQGTRDQHHRYIQYIQTIRVCFPINTL